MTSTGVLNLDMKDAKPGQRLYLPISGGLDSAYLAYRLLSMGHPLLMYHCTYRTNQNRWPHEERAYLAVLGWLLDHGLDDWTICKSEYTRNAPFTQAELDVVGAGRATKGTRYWFLDYEFLFWSAGTHLRNHPRRKEDRSDIQHVVVGSHQESRPTFGDPTFDRIWATLVSEAERPITGLEPMKRYNRTQILADMPPDLIRLCWWCRKPKNGKPCHTCSTCKAVDPALAAIGLRI